MARVLILDDNLELRGAMQTALELEKYVVVTGRSGHEGLALLESAPQWFDAIICDVRMADGNGLEVLEQIRADPRWQGMLFIMTGGSKDDQPAAMAGGADDFMLKPFGMYDLIKRLKERLGNT
jgi:DNA-binding response OmpR family regulator